MMFHRLQSFLCRHVSVFIPWVFTQRPKCHPFLWLIIDVLFVVSVPPPLPRLPLPTPDMLRRPGRTQLFDRDTKACLPR